MEGSSLSLEVREEGNDLTIERWDDVSGWTVEGSSWSRDWTVDYLVECSCQVVKGLGLKNKY